MNTVLIWLLVSVGSHKIPTHVVDRFSTADDCEFVAKSIREAEIFAQGSPKVRCIQAKVVRP